MIERQNGRMGCGGESPWSCSPEEVRAALTLRDMGLLPVGEKAMTVDLVQLLADVMNQAGERREVQELTAGVV